MECKSCNSEIDPKWKHAIDQNICPFCGQPILDEQLQSSLSSLGKEMDELVSKFPDQLDDWMKSNYSYIKMSKISQHQQSKGKKKDYSEEIQLKTINGEEYQVSGEVLQSSDVSNEFLKNAGADKVVKDQGRIKNLLKEIKSKGSPMITSIDSDEGAHSEHNDSCDNDLKKEFQTAMSDGAGEDSEINYDEEYHSGGGSGGESDDFELEDESIPAAVPATPATPATPGIPEAP